MGDSEREAALRARLLRKREQPDAGDTNRGQGRTGSDAPTGAHGQQKRAPPPPTPPEQRATGSDAELNDEQWAAIQPLFFSRNGFYGADAAVEAQNFRAFHSKYVMRVGIRGGSDGRSGGDQVAPSSEATASASSSDELGLPKRFDPRYRVNHAVLAGGGTASDPLNLRSLPVELARRLHRAGLGEAAIREVRAQLQLFEDFQQRKQLAAVQKLQADRKKLPVTAYSDRICEALRTRGVLVLAGRV